MKLLLLLFICLMMTGCVYLDTTNLDTAEPLKAGRPSAQVYVGEGIDVDTAIFIPGIFHFTNNDNVSHDKAQNGVTDGAKLAMGLGYDYELGFKTWQGQGSGYKVNVKKRFYQKDNVSIATSPAVYYLTKKEEYNKTLYGLEVPVMLTYRPAKFIAGTFQVHYNIDEFSRDGFDSNGNPTHTYGPYRFEHYGLLSGIKLTVWKVCLYGELGVERVPAVNGPITTLAIGGAGLGLEF